MKEVSKKVDSSSSEDEICTNILREAIDQQFLNNIYSIEKAKVILQSEAKPNKLDKNHSLRISSKQEDKFTNFGVAATFQSFIAKKLDEILEQTIELESSENANYCDEQKQRKDKSFGIKLLSTSKKLLTVGKVEEEYMEHEKKIQKKSTV